MSGEEEEEKKEKENKERAAYSKVSTSRIYYFVPSYTRWIIRSVSFHEPMPAVPASSPVVSSEHNDSIRDPPCPHPLLPTGKRIFLLRSPLSFAPISFPYATNWKRGEHYFFRNPGNKTPRDCMWRMQYIGTNRVSKTVVKNIKDVCRMGVFREGNLIGIFLFLDIILYATNWKRGNKALPRDERRSAKRIKWARRWLKVFVGG